MSKGVLRDTDPKQARVRRELFKLFLIKMTKEACLELKTTGLGFVLSTYSLWAQELHESGLGAQAAKYLRALADMIDPESSINKIKAAEERRRKAFDSMAEEADREGWSEVLDTRDPQP